MAAARRGVVRHGHPMSPRPRGCILAAMGYDCTLHVVDEAGFARVCARVLTGKRSPTFDGALAEAGELVAETRRLLATDPPAGARALAELALAFASTETPHVACRGFALALWDEDEDVLGPAPPAKLVAPVEKLLAPVLAKYPKARGKLPRTFDGNYCVGKFVPTRHVPALLAFVEGALAALAPGDRRPYAPLVVVLRVAAARRMAYWEATDLAVSQAHAEWLTEATPAPSSRGALTAPSTIGRFASVVAVAPQRRLVFEHGKLHDVSLAAWPPKVHTRPWHAVHATGTPWGTLLANVSDTCTRPFVFAYVEEPRGALHGKALPMGDLVAVADAVLVVGARADGVTALRADGSAQRLALPAVTGERKRGIDRFAAELGDTGSALVCWDRRAYRWDGRGTKVVALPGVLRAPFGCGAVVELPDGTLAGGFGRKLRAVARDGRQRALAPLDNVMLVALGPDEALIVGEGDNPEGDALKIVWTGTREIAHVPHALLGIDAEASLRLIYYDFDRARLVCLAGTTWRALAWAELAGLPRTSIAAYTKTRAAMQRKRRAKRRGGSRSAERSSS